MECRGWKGRFATVSGEIVTRGLTVKATDSSLGCDWTVGLRQGVGSAKEASLAAARIAFTASDGGSGDVPSQR